MKKLIIVILIAFVLGMVAESVLAAASDISIEAIFNKV